MAGIILLTLVLIGIAVLMLWMQSAQRGGSGLGGAARSVGGAPASEPDARMAEAELQLLAEHVRGLRQAVEDGLIGREDAVASIVRQAEGKVGERAAARLLDGVPD